MTTPYTPFYRLLKLILSFIMLTTAQTQVKADTPTNILATTLTFYKNGALIRQGQTLPLTSGKRLMHINGIANSIIKESLMVSLSAKPAEASIEETTFSKAENENNLVMNLMINSIIHEPKSFVNLTYLLTNMSWKPFYAIQFTSGYQQLLFNGWIEVINTAGITFKNAQTQFVDGNIPPIQGENFEKSYSKAKGYSYKGTLDIAEKDAKRLNWVASGSLKTKQDYRIFVGGKYLNDMDSKPVKPAVETWVSFYNTAKNALGQDLPPGPAVLYYQNEHGQLEVLGSTHLPHIAIGQEISVRIPTTQIDKFEKNSKKETKRIETVLEQNQFRTLSDTHVTEAHYTLSLKNTSNDAITIRVMLDLPPEAILRGTVPHDKNGENESSWNITIPANTEQQLKYQLRFIKETP
jgi:hypothetical protein